MDDALEPRFEQDVQSGDAPARGLFFAYFLWTSKESKFKKQNELISQLEEPRRRRDSQPQPRIVEIFASGFFMARIILSIVSAKCLIAASE